jgi:hypothetical protein
MTPERMRVLEMLEQGKITAAEAAELLHALEDTPTERPHSGPSGARGRRTEEPGSGDRPRWFRVRVTDTDSGRQKANVSIPYGMIGLGLRLTPGRLRLRNHGLGQMDDLLEALRSGKRGTLYDVTDKHERIEIIVD